MSRFYVVRKGLGYWQWTDADDKDWWTRRLDQAEHFRSGYNAKRVATRTGGELCELIATPVRTDPKGDRDA